MANLKKMDLAASPLIKNKQRTEKDALQRMFLLTEPAFKRAKESIDGEKYLSELDKGMRLVLNDRKLAPHKRYLKYLDLVVRRDTLKKFLNESKVANDEDSMKEFKRLEQRIRDLEMARAPDLNAENSKLSGESEREMDKSAKIFESTPVKHQFIDEESVFQNSAAEHDGLVDSSMERTSFDKTRDSVKDTSVEIYDPDTKEYFTYEPLKYEYAGRGEKLERKLEDKILREKTVYDRIEALPIRLREQFMNGREHRKDSVFIRAGIPDSKGKHYVLEGIELDPKYITIKGNSVTEKSPEGVRTIDYVMSEDLRTLRNRLLPLHKDIIMADDEHKKETSSETSDELGKKWYSFTDYDDDSKMLKFRDETFHVPNAVLDEVAKMVDKNKMLTAEAMARKIIKIKRKQLNAQSETGITLNDPTNTTAFGEPQGRSTPAAKRRLFADPNKSRQSSMSEHYKKRKNRSGKQGESGKQEGSGLKRRKWERI